MGWVVSLIRDETNIFKRKICIFLLLGVVPMKTIFLYFSGRARNKIIIEIYNKKLS